MRSKRNRAALLVAVVSFAGAVGLAAAGNLYFADGDGGVVDLADLHDGETRAFGSGDRALTATREGDEIRVTREGRGDAKALSIVCTAGTDACVVATSEDGESVVVRVEKKRSCAGGGADCVLHDVDVVALGAGDSGKRVLVQRVAGAAAGGHGNVFVVGDPAGSTLRIASERVRLACPEGDATLWVEPEEAGETFLCPKHSQPMERGPEARIETIRFESDSD